MQNLFVRFSEDDGFHHGIGLVMLVIELLDVRVFTVAPLEIIFERRERWTQEEKQPMPKSTSGIHLKPFAVDAFLSFGGHFNFLNCLF